MAGRSASPSLRRLLAPLAALVLALLAWSGPLQAAAPRAASQPGPEHAARAFLFAAQHRDFKAAYAALSSEARRSIDYLEFAQRARQLREMRPGQVKLRERAQHLSVLRVDARLTLVVDGHLVLARYAGTMTMVLSKGRWLVDAVSLRAVDKRYVSSDFHL